MRCILRGIFRRSLTILLALVAATHAVAAEPEGRLPEPPRLGRAFTPAERRASDRPYWRRNLFKRVATDQKFLLTTWWPAEARRVGFSLPIGLAIAGAAQTGSNPDSTELGLVRDFDGWATGGRRNAAESFSALGNGQTAIVVLGSTYLISAWAGNTRAQRTASLSTEALLDSMIYVSVLKRVTRRTRPANGGDGSFFVSDPGSGQEATSFPSGHATGAFTIATVVAGEFRERRWVAWVSYGTASLIALSRVALGRHFLSDVIAGAILGQSMGSMVNYRAHGLERETSAVWKRFRPYVDPENRGIGIAYQHSW